MTATWEVDYSRYDGERPAASSIWGTRRINAYRLAELALNGQTPVVYNDAWKPDGTLGKVRNQAETMIADEKSKALDVEFARWLWTDPARADRLAALYNDRFNSTVPRVYNGAHLTYPGIDPLFKPYSWQRDAAWRICQSASALIAHPVGSGKTASMGMAAITLRRLGLANKPMIVVPNHLLEQVARDIKRLFPQSRVLMAGKDDLSPERRRLFAARCASGDWDAVVITQSAFTSLPVGDRVEVAYLADRIVERRAAQTSRAEDDLNRGRASKRLAKSLDQTETRMQALLSHRTDDTVVFPQLGVDYLLMDESHLFKNLGVTASGRTEGFSLPSSKRATDLHMKVEFLRRRNPNGRHASFFSGTPVSNTLAEVFVLQTYLDPDELRRAGLGTFEAWAASFCVFESRVEVSPDGGSFRLHRRPSRFRNVPELRRMLARFTDFRLAKDLNLPSPPVERETVVVPATDSLRTYVMKLSDRADAIRAGKISREIDNMLSVCGDGRRAALDPGLVGLPRTGPTKAEVCAQNAHRLWVENKDLQFTDPVTGKPSPVRGGGQVIFCDQGTPGNNGPQVYGQVREWLVRSGVPAAQVRFVHDARTDAAKTALFADFRAGRFAFLLGSTEKLGLGTNIQNRMVAVHHLDAPWKPSEIAQREGRKDRPGNQCPTTYTFTYVTEGSFDAYMWQALERKARFIEQVMAGTGANDEREVEDVGETVLSYAEIKSLASGNPLLLDLAAADGELARLRSLKAAWEREQRRARDEADTNRQKAADATSWADLAQEIVAATAPVPDTGRDQRNRSVMEITGLVRNAKKSWSNVRCGMWRGLELESHQVQARWDNPNGVTHQRVWLLPPGGPRHTSKGTVVVPVSPSWFNGGQQYRLLNSIDMTLDLLPERVRDQRVSAREHLAVAADWQAQTGGTFDGAELFAAAKQTRDDLHAKVVDEAAARETVVRVVGGMPDPEPLAA